MSGVLLDTDIALWALGDPSRLTDGERDLLVDPSVQRFLSPMSIWEAAIKREAGRLRAPRNLTGVMAAEFTLVPVTASLLEHAAELPRHHADPFDRVLVAHALSADLAVMTRDPVFPAYGVRLAVRA